MALRKIAWKFILSFHGKYSLIDWKVLHGILWRWLVFYSSLLAGCENAKCAKDTVPFAQARSALRVFAANQHRSSLIWFFSLKKEAVPQGEPCGTASLTYSILVSWIRT
jgi:hypothetical protein